MMANNKKNKKKKNAAKGTFNKPVSKPEATEKPVNPFDIHYNKVKRNVVGRKLMRCEQGRPNRSRHEAVEKRKKTLLQEYLKKDKTGKFQDKRITDDSGGVAARKAKIFDLKMKGVDEASLTHQGQHLSSENLLTDRPITDDFEDDVDLNLLKRPDYVEAAHFGGGEESDQQRKSQSEYLDEVIAEKRKRQYEQEMTWSLTEKLDDEWKDVRSLLTSVNPSTSTKPHPASGDERNKLRDEEPVLSKDYDVVMREMMFAAKSGKANAKSASSKESADSTNDPKSRSQQKSDSSLNLTDEQKKRQMAIERIRQNNVVILPFFEPRVDGLACKRDPLKKLQKKVKREFKGAQRELRKDSAFLKDVWMKEMSERDDDRKKKVKKIIADLASDIHDARLMKRAA